MNFRKLLGGGTILAGLTVLGLVGLARPALAGSADSNINVSTTVESSCTITTTNPSLPDYDANATQDTTSYTGEITYQCTPGSTATIQLSAGNSNSYTTRTMTYLTNTLNYQIYTDDNKTQIWGDGTSDTTTVSATADGASHPTNYYVDVTSGQFVQTGAYSDTVQAEIDF